MVIDLLTDPATFFERRAEDGGLAIPAVVALATAVVGIVDGLLFQGAIQSAFPGGGPGAGAALGTFLTLGTTLVRTAAVWLGVTGALLLLARRFGGEGGDFRTLLALTGWCLVPMLAYGLLGVAVVAVAMGGVPAPSAPDEIGRFVSGVTGNGFVVVARRLAFAFVLWQGFLWTFAVRGAFDLDLAVAVRTAAAPVVGVLLWTAYVQFASLPGFVLRSQLLRPLLSGGGPV